MIVKSVYITLFLILQIFTDDQIEWLFDLICNNNYSFAISNMIQKVLIFLLATVLVVSLKSSHHQSKPIAVKIEETDSFFSYLTQLQKEELKKINIYRAQHGCDPLVINQTLNKIAQTYSERLYLRHSSDHSEEALKGDYGENIYWAAGFPILNYTAGDATSTWYNQNSHYDYEKGKAKNPEQVIGHFTAMIWKNVKSVGFGFAGGPETRFRPKGKGAYIVANFYPPPNYIGQFVENVPKPVS